MSDKETPTLQEIVDFMTAVWVDEPKTVSYQTGREGAILQEILITTYLKEMVLGRKLTAEEKAAIKAETESKVWEDGLYEISTDGMKYLGLWDSNQPDGMFGVKVRGIHYIERWKDGHRIEYEIVSEEEWLRIKNNRSIPVVEVKPDKENGLP